MFFNAGLQHLHSLTPPLTHNRFKTAKVLLDADFNPKVSNAGLSRLVETREEEEADAHEPEYCFTFDKLHDLFKKS